MTPDTRLEQLRARAGRSLRSFLRRNRSPIPTPGADQSATRRAVANSHDPWPTTVALDTSLTDEPALLRDERRMRALAKEIKRLIAEDSRRGL
jgi:hypothetical protein